MINWVLQLNNSQVGKLAQQSFGEAPRVKLSKPTQSKPNPICDRSGKPEVTERGFCGEREKRPVHKRSMINVCKKNLVLQIEQGKPVKSEDKRVNACSRWNRGNPVKSRANTHTVEEFVPAEHRDTASSNANKFNFATDEENIDFNIPGSAEFDGETITWRQRSQLDSEDREPTLNDKHFKVTFNNIDHSTLSAENHKMRSKLLGTLNYAR